MSHSSGELAQSIGSGGQVSRKRLHDIRASLAILSGFGDALDSSLKELSSHMDTVMQQAGVQPGLKAIGELKTLEADCRFCLSRIRASSTQLKERLDALASDCPDA